MATDDPERGEARLGALSDDVEAGADRRARKPLALGELARFRATMPRMRQPSARLLREMRDEGL